MPNVEIIIPMSVGSMSLISPKKIGKQKNRDIKRNTKY